MIHSVVYTKKAHKEKCCIRLEVSEMSKTTQHEIKFKNIMTALKHLFLPHSYLTQQNLTILVLPNLTLQEAIIT